MEKILPILSDRFKHCLEQVRDKHNNQIAKDLLRVDELVNLYNRWTEASSKLDPALIALKNYIDTLITDEVRALSMRPNVFEVSFTPKGKELIYSSSGTWSREGRQTGKPARIIKKLLKKVYKSIDLEVFNNLLKAEVMDCGDFCIVYGDDIQKYYNQNMYYKITGTLGASCMKYDECSDYFDIYKENAGMLVCIKDGKLLGRAVIWDLPDYTLMDRVYTCDDYLEEQFVEYAKDHNWWMRETNQMVSDGEETTWIGPKDNYTVGQYLSINFKLQHHYCNFPYVDSFRYYDTDTHEISTNPEFGNARLSCTEGGYYNCNIYYCSHCGETIRSWNDDDDEEMMYSDYLGEYFCSDCCEFNEFISDYVCIYDEKVNVIYHKQEIEIPLNYVRMHLTTEYSYTLDSNSFIKLNGTYYHKSCFHWDLDNDKYILDED